jgi:hypothetical protein
MAERGIIFFTKAIIKFLRVEGGICPPSTPPPSAIDGNESKSHTLHYPKKKSNIQHYSQQNISEIKDKSLV